MLQLYWIDPESPAENFPDISNILDEPEGLLAFGGDLSGERLIYAYRKGIFPWYSPGEPILWWSPNPRSVLFPEKIHLSRSLKKIINKQIFDIRYDTNFEEVIENCSKPRRDSTGTWITDEMKQAYINLHQLGYAHSVEAWNNEKLVGGLYGVFMGRVFFGESMFSKVTDASKACLAHLATNAENIGIDLIDCQVTSDHLNSLGAVDISQEDFKKLITALACEKNDRVGKW